MTFTERGVWEVWNWGILICREEPRPTLERGLREPKGDLIWLGFARMDFLLFALGRRTDFESGSEMLLWLVFGQFWDISQAFSFYYFSIS